MPQEEKVTLALPESLRRQFTALQKRLFSVESTFAAASALGALLLGLLLLFISDRFWDTPVWLRTALFVFALAGVACIAAWWIKLWVVRPRDWRSLAVLVQHKYRRLGDRLLGIVELSEESKRPAYFSPELYRAAIEQVAQESEKYDFSQAAAVRPARRQIAIAAGLFALVAIAAVLLPEATWNSFRRWIAPLARIPRYTLVELAELPTEQIVPHGEKFTLQGKVTYRSFWKPARIFMESRSGARIETIAKNGTFSFEVPAQTEDNRMTVQVGDASRMVTILPRHRPAILQAGAIVQLPEYLGHPPELQAAQSGLIEALEGSSLVLTGRTSRPIRSAWLRIGEREAGIAVTNDTFATPSLSANSLSELALRWSDSIGLSNTAPWKLAVQTKPDSAPLPQIEELYRETAMLETEVLPIPVRASDDFGLKNLGVSWAIEATQEITNAVARKEYTQEIHGKDTQYLEQTFNFSPAVLGIPAESTIELHAFALDYFPGRERTESPAYRIHVIGNAQHAEMVRQNLESLLVQLEEITRLEEKVASETRELKDLQKLDTPETAKKIAELEQEQQESSAQLQDLASEGMKTLREALRNPAFDEQVLSEWTKNLHQMEKVAQQPMKDAAKALKSAAQSQSPSDREQQLAEAEKKEDETLKSLQEMQKKVNQGLDELQALTLAQRLRQVGSKQKKLETTLQNNIPDTIGLVPDELPPRYQKANTQLAAWQQDALAESAKLQGEISRFYERTQKPNYGEVTEQMKKDKPADELDRIRTLIRENIGMEAMQNLAVWSEKFEAWAAKLEPKSDDKDKKGGSGEGGEGKKDDSALKQLIGLLRFREKQVNIEERTRLLHDHLDEKHVYQDGAVLLAASQAKLGRDLSKQAIENSFALLEGPYNEAISSMSDVEALLDRPRTDQVTVTAQDKSVSVLSDLINLLNEEAKKSGGQNSGKSKEQSGEQMAFLMQAMAPQPSPGMKAGQNPGANMSGGTTDKASQAGAGNNAGKSADERGVKKSSGVPANYPTEFREALENYYKALEQIDSKGAESK